VPVALAEEMNRRLGWSVQEMCNHEAVYTEPEMLKTMLRLAMNVAYYMANVDRAVEESQRGGWRTIKVNGEPAVVDEWWRPRWVGQEYKRSVIIGGPPAGTHASPKMHWRRGHWRNQPVGEGRSDRRRTWIQPILVMAKVEDG